MDSPPQLPTVLPPWPTFYFSNVPRLFSALGFALPDTQPATYFSQVFRYLLPFCKGQHSIVIETVHSDVSCVG